MPTTTFRRHAFIRVAERLCLSQKEIKRLIDTDKTIAVGIEPGTRRVHHLFYSQVDYLCFVAVRDEKNGEVVTILPADYDTRCRISPDAIEQAIELAERTTVQVEEAQNKKKVGNQPNLTPSTFHFTVYFSGPRVRIKAMKWSAVPYQGDIRQLEKDVSAEKALKEFIALHLRDGEHFDTFFVQLGKKGKPTKLNWKL